MGAVFTVRSVCDIEAGEELCLSYIPLDQPTQRRRMHLATNWMFMCQCVRCVDADADTKPIDVFCCPDKKCAGGLLVPEAEEEDGGHAKEEEGEDRGHGKENGRTGWCRICNSSATLPTSADRKSFFKSSTSPT